ncbi:MAG TPA: hypothetical protein VLY23_00105 [Candidatus Acidoferrum sp.]|nr:hypothetical protein [Candidatus Acidoferrum sp.]
MKSILFLLIALFAFASSALAQHGTAENGYYPSGYEGDTWTGQVVSANEHTREITLSYTHNGKSQTFVGAPEDGYLVHEHNGPTRPLKMSDIPVGRIIKVWYVPETKKVDGRKVKVNTIFLIDAVANAKESRTYFKAFN